MPSIGQFDYVSDQSQPTLNGVQDYVAAARTQLQDKIQPYRYDDTSLVNALNVTMLEAQRMRADLFVFNVAYNGQPPNFSGVDGTYVPIETQFRPAILNGLIGFALQRSQEDSQDSVGFLQLFVTGLIGRAYAAVSVGSGGPQR